MAEKSSDKRKKERPFLRYAIFGTGRVGTSIAAWLRLLGHEVDAVSHRDADARAPAARSAVARADIVAAAIPDGAIAPWREAWREEIGARTAIHFSGALIAPGLFSVHPLCSFPQTPLAPAAMARIAFALQAGAPPLSAIFPGADNASFVVADEDRAFYHALAVLSGNFATHLWTEVGAAMQSRLGLDPAAILGPYLEGVVARFAESPRNALTGPVARRDRASADANLAALAGDPKLEALYRAFLASAWPGFGEKEAIGNGQ